jgi:hypothetical protein
MTVAGEEEIKRKNNCRNLCASVAGEKITPLVTEFIFLALSYSLNLGHIPFISLYSIFLKV